VGAATVFEISGSPKALVQGLDMLCKGGTLVAFGIYPEAIPVDFTRKVVREMKTIRGVYGASGVARNKVLPLMASGQLRLGPLVTHRLPLQKADEGFRACLRKEAMKVMLIPG
jgi:threonine dehydrogenase-like Zn-dependent dehydrogenase